MGADASCGTQRVMDAPTTDQTLKPRELKCKRCGAKPRSVQPILTPAPDAPFACSSANAVNASETIKRARVIEGRSGNSMNDGGAQHRADRHGAESSSFANDHPGRLVGFCWRRFERVQDSPQHIEIGVDQDHREKISFRADGV